MDMEMTTSFGFCILWTGELQHWKSNSQNIRHQNNWMGARPLRDMSQSSKKISEKLPWYRSWFLVKHDVQNDIIKLTLSNNQFSF